MPYEPEDPNAKWVREYTYGMTTGYGVGPAGSLGNQAHELQNRPLVLTPPAQSRPDDYGPPAVSPLPTDGGTGPTDERWRGRRHREPGLGGFAEWIEQHCPPLRGAHRLGQWLIERRWPWRLPAATLGALLLFAMLETRAFWPLLGVSASSGIASLTAAHAWWLGTAAGGWLGWHTVSIVGAIVRLSARLVALALALSFMAAVLGAIYLALALYFGWPTPL
jgi:hypothetical protein